MHGERTVWRVHNAVMPLPPDGRGKNAT